MLRIGITRIEEVILHVRIGGRAAHSLLNLTTAGSI
jgi:3-mercaptopyruvate sulfurtransferase SseA